MGIMGSLVWIVIGAIVLLRMVFRDISGVTAEGGRRKAARA